MHSLIFNAAQAIVPHLPELLGEQAETVNAQLQILLAKQQNGEPAEAEIIALLRSHAATRQWMNDRLNSGQETASKGLDTLTFSELPGDRGHVKGAKYYKCPQCDYRWTRAMDWQTPPKCPEHDIDLVEDN